MNVILLAVLIKQILFLDRAPIATLSGKFLTMLLSLRTKNHCHRTVVCRMCQKRILRMSVSHTNGSFAAVCEVLSAWPEVTIRQRVWHPGTRHSTLLVLAPVCINTQPKQ